VPAVTASGRSHVVSWTVGVKYLTASLIERRISPRNSVTVGRVAWSTLQLRGRIQSANIGDIQAQMDDEHVRIFMDLGEVTLVDVEVVRFLSECEGGAIILVHCPPYVREWILRERAEGA
jgi:hypothetical protein